MSATEMDRFLKANPKYREILQRAIEIEEANSKNPHWLGWEWHEARAYPAQLVKLVIEGVARVNFKSNSSTNYLLVNRELVRQILNATPEPAHR
jgi:hypothetical protein